jgi:myo-inositol 2-dehydrogenase / D-chiro-inositol 1-dehydrogenase
VKKINVGIIGVGGRIGKMHIENLMRMQHKVNIVGVCDLIEESSDYFAGLCSGESFTDYSKMLKRNDIDTVFILTPSDSHYDISIASAKAGKNIFCEKPLAETMEKAEKIANVINDTKVKYQPGYQRRFDPSYYEAKQLIDAGKIGKPILFKSTSRDPFPPPAWACNPATGGGCYLDMVTHDFDLARWFLESEATQVFSNDSHLLGIDYDIEDLVDNVTVSLKFRNNTLALIDGNWNSKGGYDVRSEISGSEGTIFIGGLVSSPVTLFTSDGLNMTETYENFLHRFRDAYFLEIESFVDNLIDNKPLLITEKDGLAAMRISMAALESSIKKKSVQLG